MNMTRRSSLSSLRDFTPGNFPEPHNPIRLDIVPNWEPETGGGNFRLRRRGLRDFVPGSFPEPHNPIVSMNGLRDFVPGNFPEPHNPLYGMAGVGCACGGKCDDCGGMGAVAVPTWAASLPAPLNSTAAGFPVVYWAAGGLAALVVLPMILGGGRRRR